jgi:O-antigen/teichoic acid export membrane protein
VLAGSAGGAAPDLIFGRTLGFTEVALYSRAKGLIAMALEHLLHVVRSVYAPAFAKGVREGRDPASLYVDTIGMLLGLSVPVIALLTILAPYLILWLFGEQWARAAPLGSLFCAFALLTAPFTLTSISLIASGHVGLMMRMRLMIESVRIVVLLASIQFSLETVVYLLVIVYLVEGALSMRALRIGIALKGTALWSGSWRSYALVPFVLAGPSVVLLVAKFVQPLPTLLLLAVSVVLALVGWFVGLSAVHHPLRAEVASASRWILDDLRGRVRGRRL